MTERLAVSVPEAGRMLGLGRDAAYLAAKRGDIPTYRVGRRLLVPLDRLREQVNRGATVEESGDAA